MQLFVFTKDYIASYFDYPAWLACLTGDFFTQFFYYVAGGATTLTIVLLLLIWTVYKTTRKIFVPGYALIIALIITTIEALRNTGLTYPLSSSISLLGGFLLGWISISLNVTRLTAFIVNIFLLGIGYWLFGYGIWIILIIILIHEIKEFNWQAPLLYVLFVLAFPMILRSHYLLTLYQSYQYPLKTVWSNYLNLPDIERELILSMDIEGYFGNWDVVLEKAKQKDLKNTSATYFYNLANSHMNDLPENLLNYYQPASKGLFLEIGPHSSVLSILFSNEAWFLLGDMTLAEHSAMLGQIFSYNNRSSRMIKRLAEINLITGETKAAEKYLLILNHTLCHNNWAKSRMPQNQTEAYRTWLAAKKRGHTKIDTLRSGLDVVTSLRNLLDNNPANHTACDYLLCYQLLNKNIPSFVEDYSAYYKPLIFMPKKIYAEALLIYLIQQKVSEKEFSSYQIPAEIVKDFSTYTEMYDKGLAEQLESDFSNSYWFYYHFATFQKK